MNIEPDSRQLVTLEQALLSRIPKKELQRWLEEKYGCEFFDGCLPVGYRATAEFLERIGDFFGCR